MLHLNLMFRLNPKNLIDPMFLLLLIDPLNQKFLTMLMNLTPLIFHCFLLNLKYRLNLKNLIGLMFL